MSIFNMGRVRNMFQNPNPQPLDPSLRSNGGTITESSAPGSAETLAPIQKKSSPADDYYDAIRRERANMPVNDSYKDLLLNGAPNREANKPSGWRRLAAAVAGGAQGFTGDIRGGLQTAQNIDEQPFRNKMSDYETRVRTTGAGAEIERKKVDDAVDSMTRAQQLGLTYQQMLERNRHDLVGENQKQQELDKDTYEPQQMMSGVRMVNKSNPSDYYDLPGETVASVNAKTGQGNLAVNKSNAATNARRANIYGSSVTNENANRDANTEIARTKAATAQKRADALSKKGIPPAAQKTAEEMALRDMYRDPRTSKFMQETQPGFPDFNNSVDPETHKRLSNILNEKMAGYLGLSLEDLGAYDPDSDEEDPN